MPSNQFYGTTSKRAKPDTYWPVVDPGEMPHTVSIEQQSTAVDSVGQTVQTWAAVISNTRAGVESGNVGEQFVADGQQSQVTHVWTLNFPSGAVVAPGMRVNFQAPDTVHYYRIIAVDNVKMLGVVLRLKCLELYGVSD